MALATIFECDSSIFRCKRMQDVAARLHRAGTGEPWNALITPPACGMSGLCSPTAALLHLRPRFGMLAHLPLSVDPPTNRGGLAPARANRICEYIDSHLQENIALEVLAEIAQLSVHHFARAFRQSLGIPPHNYIVQRRVEHAQQLLRNTELPLRRLRLRRVSRTKVTLPDTSGQLRAFLLAWLVIENGSLLGLVVGEIVSESEEYCNEQRSRPVEEWRRESKMPQVSHICR
jgi:AraC-like DNA-binding protein